MIVSSARGLSFLSSLSCSDLHATCLACPLGSDTFIEYLPNGRWHLEAYDVLTEFRSFFILTVLHCWLSQNWFLDVVVVSVEDEGAWLAVFSEHH